MLSADVSNLTETDTAVDISTSGTLTISDVDSPATFVAQAGTVGSYGTFAIDTAGAWTYTASSAHNEFAAGTTYTDTFAVASADGTTTSVTINILGTNDAAVLSADVSNLTETDTAADISTSGTLTISDVDSPATFVAQAATVGSYGTFAIDTAGAWTYTASSATTSLPPAPPTPTPSRSPAPTAPSPRSPSTSSAPTTPRLLSADVRDLSETNAAADICHLRHAHHQRRRQPRHLRGAGRHRRQLRHLRHRHRRRLDLHRQLGAQRVCRRRHLHRHLLGRQRRRHPTLGHHQHPRHQRRRGALRRRPRSERDQRGGDISTSGTLTISDVDSPATFVAQAATVGSYGTFAIDTAGAWTYTASSAHNEFAAGTTYTDTFSVASADGTLSSVTINILGTNDAAVVSADVRDLSETNAAVDISTAGMLTISDVDSPATFVAQAATVGSYGTFAIDTAGAWTYTASSAHNEFAAGTTYTDTFSVASADGTLSSVTINILGTNDAAVLSADVRDLSETNAAADISTSGTLTISDVDSPATFVAQAATVGSYGTFAIDTAGAWTYTASSAHNEFAAGATYTDTFSVASADGTLSSVTINILGTNDAADTMFSTAHCRLSANVETLVLQGNADLQGYGNSDANTLYGNAGNNLLNGEAGADRMVGGAGNDTYFVDNSNDVVFENANEGSDAVLSTAHYRLSANVETLVLQGNADLQGYGNSDANTLYGNAGNNLLNGEAGADTMLGGAGNDTYFVDNSNDVVFENANEGSDAVLSTAHYRLSANVETLVLQGHADLQGYGNSDANTLYGNAGNNLLNGEAGADRMVGGAGNDTYFVDNSNDVVFENANEGNDAVFSTAHYRLSANVETLVLQGNADLQGYGNSDANTLYGNAGNNLLNGEAGADRMVGGAGNDTYFVDDSGDLVFENANEGTDAVFATVNYTLTANVETLVLQGAGDLSGTGNALDNKVYGNAGDNALNGGAGADMLNGGAGHDTLTGGTGNDTFVFGVGQADGDIIVDFDGQGAAAGDSLQFVGYGPGATFTQNDATHWQIDYNGGSSHELITFMNGAAIHASDWHFV